MLGAVLVTERSACWLIVSVSVAELLAGFGSVTPPGAADGGRVGQRAGGRRGRWWPTPCR